MLGESGRKYNLQELETKWIQGPSEEEVRDSP